MAALTTATPGSKRYPQRIGTRLEWEGVLNGPGSYTSPGGDIIPPGLLGMNAIESGVVAADSTGARIGAITVIAGVARLKIYTAIGTEAVNATNQSAIAFQVRIVGH